MNLPHNHLYLFECSSLLDPLYLLVFEAHQKNLGQLAVRWAGCKDLERTG